MNRGHCSRTPEILRFTARIRRTPDEPRSIPANPGRRADTRLASPQSPTLRSGATRLDRVGARLSLLTAVSLERHYRITGDELVLSETWKQSGKTMERDPNVSAREIDSTVRVSARDYLAIAIQGGRLGPPHQCLCPNR